MKGFPPRREWFYRILAAVLSFAAGMEALLELFWPIFSKNKPSKIGQKATADSPAAAQIRII